MPRVRDMLRPPNYDETESPAGSGGLGFEPFHDTPSTALAIPPAYAREIPADVLREAAPGTWAIEARVTDAESYVRVGQNGALARSTVKSIKAWFTERKARARKVWTDWCDLEAQLCAAPQGFADAAAKELAAYDAAREQERIATEARLLAVETARLETARVTEAAALEASGDPEMVETAEALMAAPLPVPVVHVTKNLPQVRGVVHTRKAVGRVTDWTAFLKGIASGEIPRTVIAVEQGELDREVTRMNKLHPEGWTWPGVTVEIVTGTRLGR